LQAGRCGRGGRTPLACGVLDSLSQLRGNTPATVAFWPGGWLGTAVWSPPCATRMTTGRTARWSGRAVASASARCRSLGPLATGGRCCWVGRAESAAV